MYFFVVMVSGVGYVYLAFETTFGMAPYVQVQNEDVFEVGVTNDTFGTVVFHMLK